MTTKKTKSKALKLMEEIVGPLKFSKMLLAIRECDELSQAEFSRLLGISRQNLCDIEKGRKRVSPSRAVKFAKALGYPPEGFVMLALQEELDNEKLKMKVFVEAA